MTKMSVDDLLFAFRTWDFSAGGPFNSLDRAKRCMMRAVEVIEELSAAPPAPHAALRKLISAVKTYQFTPEDTPEKSMAAADLDDAVDEARAALQPEAPAPVLSGQMSSAEFHQQRGRHYDIIREAVSTYDEYMLDDDYDAQGTLDKIIKRMRERLDMSAPPSSNSPGGMKSMESGNE